MKELSSFRILRALCIPLIAAFAVAFTGCDGDTDETHDPPELSGPLQSSVYLAEGTSYELTGFAAGHLPGRPSIFTLVLLSAADEAWEGQFCMLLLNDEGIEQTLLLEDFEVPSDASRDYQVDDDWAADLEHGPYGLAVVFPGRSVHNLTIWVGEESEDPVPTWPAIQDCEE